MGHRYRHNSITKPHQSFPICPAVPIPEGSLPVCTLDRVPVRRRKPCAGKAFCRAFWSTETGEARNAMSLNQTVPAGRLRARLY